VKQGGKCVFLTSSANEIIVRAALAQVRRGGGNGKAEASSCGDAWDVELRYSFLLFSKMKARIYVLRRTQNTPPPILVACLRCSEALAALRGHAEANATKWKQISSAKCEHDAQNIRKSELHWDHDKPTLFVHKLGGGGCNRLPWDDGRSWEIQWRLSRPSLDVVK